MADKPQKISIGFHGGQTLVARVKPEVLTSLRAALGQGGGWHELQAESGTAIFDLARIDYVLIDDDSSRVGF